MPSAPLFDVRVTHDYYADQRCGDFAIVPAAATESAMARLRLTCKSFADRIRIYAELDAKGDVVAAAAAPLSLQFALQPRGSSYAAITRLSDIAQQPAPLFTNEGVQLADPLPLRLTTRRATARESLVVSAPAAAETFVLSGTPLNGTVPADVTVAGAGAVTSVRPGSKRITIDTSALARGTVFQVSYPVRAATPRGALAEIALTLDAQALKPMPAPRGFVVPLSSADARWAYYVVTDFSGDLSTLTVVDATAGNGPRAITVSDAGRAELTTATVGADPVGADLLGRARGRRVVRLVSDAAIPTRDTPLGALELRLDNAPLLSRLPNPPPDRLVLLQTGAPSSRQMVRYQVLSLLTN
ncbi:hypothetical protein SSBR45G_12130 [Bradyrhizobium sp. SSBR45G]|uniref:hypothetical protein n=1 Tax=unclassified Bradyrhizobium TaxID=2631580 RepID=UPI002342AC54|nr:MULTISPECIES: hypothetical protein [unclassified Bradyrhizobium]GLH76305.1 hypothetical protein SSBR45G_12130 [Bradyrhizobium sp. SSBR45G]GLH83211.1 hypothetical protein SSBR45R_06710 [Bradyrhizobium sp. SSBR45R]